VSTAGAKDPLPIARLPERFDPEPASAESPESRSVSDGRRPTVRIAYRSFTVISREVMPMSAIRHKPVAGGPKPVADPEDRDEYTAENVFWVPKEARWGFLQANAKQPIIGKLIDDAMVAIEKENPLLKGVLPKDYARPALDKTASTARTWTVVT
jgi:hypothetical protein